MNFALLGHSSAVTPLLNAIADDDTHSLVALAAIDDQTIAELIQQFPSARMLSSWEEMLTESKIDRVIVVGHIEPVLTGAKQLAMEGIPVVLLPEARQGSAFIYELSLVQDDNQVRLIPLNQLSADPSVLELTRQIKDGGLGQVSLFRIDRSIRSESGQALLSQQEVDHTLLPDVQLLWRIVGGYNRVTCVYTGTSGELLSQATVTLGGQDIPEATWTGRVGEPSLQMVVVGDQATATLSIDSQSKSKLVISSGDESKTIAADETASLGAGLIQQAVGDGSIEAWQDATRSFETVEATHTSLRRRRTIDLYFETTSERSIFKSQMAAVGCGLIILTLFGLVAFLLLGAFLDSRTIAQRRAQSDGRVVQTTVWEKETAQLNEVGSERIVEIARRLEASPQAIFVMPEVGEEFAELNDQRRNKIIEELTNRGRPEAVQFVEFASVPSKFTQTLLEILRIAWVAPLVIFLVLQTLLVITRPSAAEQEVGRVEG